MDVLLLPPPSFFHFVRILLLEGAAKTLYDQRVLVGVMGKKPAKIRSPVSDIRKYCPTKGHGDLPVLQMPPDLGA
jgi:hypothetical protein